MNDNDNSSNEATLNIEPTATTDVSAAAPSDVTDLRGVIKEAASAEAAASPSPTEPHSLGKPGAGAATALAADGTAQPNTPAAATPEAKQALRVTRPPQSWRGEGKAVWETLPLVARQEIHRREQDAQAVFRENTQAREFVGTLEQTISPHLGWIGASGQNPMEAIGTLLQMENVARSGTSQQKVALAAQYLLDYGVDLNELDAALSQRLQGGAPAAPAGQDFSEMVNQAVNQRLEPIMQERSRAENQMMQGAVSQFASTPGNEYFEDLRLDMADILDAAAYKGVPMDLPRAYKIAAGMNPGIAMKTKAAASNNLRGAAQSIAGNSQRVAPAHTDPNDLRALIQAQFGG